MATKREERQAARQAKAAQRIYELKTLMASKDLPPRLRAKAESAIASAEKAGAVDIGAILALIEALIAIFKAWKS